MQRHPRFDSVDLSRLKPLISGGAPCPAPIFERFFARGVDFKTGYGLTEAGPNTFWLPASDVRRKPGSVGVPLFNVEVRLDGGGEEGSCSSAGSMSARAMGAGPRRAPRRSKGDGCTRATSPSVTPRGALPHRRTREGPHHLRRREHLPFRSRRRPLRASGSRRGLRHRRSRPHVGGDSSRACRPAPRVRPPSAPATCLPAVMGGWPGTRRLGPLASSRRCLGPPRARWSGGPWLPAWAP